MRKRDWSHSTQDWRPAVSDFCNARRCKDIAQVISDDVVTADLTKDYTNSSAIVSMTDMVRRKKPPATAQTTPMLQRLGRVEINVLKLVFCTDFSCSRA